MLIFGKFMEVWVCCFCPLFRLGNLLGSCQQPGANTVFYLVNLCVLFFSCINLLSSLSHIVEYSLRKDVYCKNPLTFYLQVHCEEDETSAVLYSECLRNDKGFIVLLLLQLSSLLDLFGLVVIVGPIYLFIHVVWKNETFVFVQ